MDDYLDQDDSSDNSDIIEVELEADVTETLRDVDGEHPGGNCNGHRRRSMSHEEERERRASIKAILADDTITPFERRRSIQSLMDGRRSSIGTASIASCSMSSEMSSNSNTDDMYDYGYGNPHVYGDETDNNDNSNVNTAICIPVSNEFTKRAELTRPPCNHYARNCTLIAPCCGAAFGCRICHDDSPILPPLLIAKRASRRSTRSSSMPGGFTSMDDSANQHHQHDTHHTIDRFLVSEIICRECNTKQSSKTNNCVNCNVQFGEYHCSVCNLWMANDENPYHCPDCGFCRVGGEENFKHCHDCGMCIDKTLYDNHNCKDGKYKSNCPVCQEFLFSSRSASHEMPCGHAIHWECFRQLATHDSRCPVCKKTAETKERMMPTWNAMASGVTLQPVPPELARVVNITCIDCETSEDARAWHFLGVQCRNCSSFNTVVDRIIMSGEEANEFLEALQTRSDLANNEEGSERISRRRISRRRSHF